MYEVPLTQKSFSNQTWQIRDQLEPIAKSEWGNLSPSHEISDCVVSKIGIWKTTEKRGLRGFWLCGHKNSPNSKCDRTFMQ